MTDGLTEAVARAICQAEGVVGVDYRWQDYAEAAAAAIAAMTAHPTAADDGSLTLDNASAQRLMDYGLLHRTDEGWHVGEWPQTNTPAHPTAEPTEAQVRHISDSFSVDTGLHSPAQAEAIVRRTIRGVAEQAPTAELGDLEGLVERPALVRQKQPFGCTAAVLAMILGVTYEEAAAKLATDPADFDTQGHGYHVMESQLVQHGYAISRKWRVFQPGNQKRDQWPCEPFADLHWCEVIAGPRGAHAVIMLRDGTVLDPMCDEPRRLADYEEVNFIAAVVLVTSNASLLAELAALRERAGKLVEWWPEGSEHGTAAERYGAGFADDLAALRAALEPPRASEEKE